MALIVEDGTGVEGAESYASLDDAEAYWAKRPHSPFAAVWSNDTKTDDEREGALREASSYVDATWGGGYLGLRAGVEQGLLWPRVTARGDPGVCQSLYRHYGIALPYGAPCSYLLCEVATEDVDWTIVYGSDGLELAALPAQIVDATIELAARALIQPLTADYLTGQRLKSERAGDTENVYFDDGRSASSYGNVALILAPVLGVGGQAGWAWR